MQALQLTEWQHEPELREVDAPQPGPGEALVRVVAAGACHSDLVQRHRLDGALDAYGAMRHGSLEGRAVIVHGD